MLALCLLIILFNYLGMNQTLNLIISSALLEYLLLGTTKEADCVLPF